MGAILNFSFYRFTRLRDLEALRERVKSRAIAEGLHGSILLSEEGINGFLAGDPAKLRPYFAWLVTEIPDLASVAPKESFSADIPFTRMLVKLKKEIITMGRPEVMPSEKTGKNIAAAELKRWYDEKKDFVIVDTRNGYEIDHGAFDGAVHYSIDTFREFPEKFEKAANELRDKTVVMYCTGGIRCEKATALAMDLGIKDVYQLEGGILKYFEEVGGSHYQGECFIFDHRAAVDPGLAPLPERKLKEKTDGLKLEFNAEDSHAVRVVLALKAKGLPFERIERAELAAPVLQHGERSIVSSSEILRYLDSTFPETLVLTPDAAERRERMGLWIAWVDGPFAAEATRWTSARTALSAEESHALEVRLEKHLYRLKTPLQKNRRYLVVDELTQADIAAYSVLEPLRASGFPKDYPERFTPVWEWSARVREVVDAGLRPTPKVLRRAGSSVWPN
jgi:UPF0176 protein